MGSCTIAITYLAAALVHQNAERVRVIPYAAKMPAQVCKFHIEHKTGRRFRSGYWHKDVHYTRTFLQMVNRCYKCNEIAEAEFDGRNARSVLLGMAAKAMSRHFEDKLQIHALATDLKYRGLPRWYAPKIQDYGLVASLESQSSRLLLHMSLKELEKLP